MLSRIIQFEGGGKSRKSGGTAPWRGDLYLQGFPEVSQEVVKGEGSASSKWSDNGIHGGVCDKTSFFLPIHRTPPVRKLA
jgi:hypothetical protein